MSCYIYSLFTLRKPQWRARCSQSEQTVDIFKQKAANSAFYPHFARHDIGNTNSMLVVFMWYLVKHLDIVDTSRVSDLTVTMMTNRILCPVFTDNHLGQIVIVI